MTDDFIIITGIALLAGATNLIFALIDEHKTAKMTDAQSARIDGLISTVEQLLPTKPLSLLNLRSLSDAELQSITSRVVGDFRLFEAKRQQKHQEHSNRRFSRRASLESGSAEAFRRAWAYDQDEYIDQLDRERAEFCEKLRPPGLAVMEELRRRLPQAPPPRGHVLASLEQGLLAGIRPVDEVADELERLARMLTPARGDVTYGAQSPIVRGGINQSHSGSGDNVAIEGDVHIGARRFEMTVEIAEEIYEKLDRSRPVTVAHTINVRSEKYAVILRAHLETKGLAIAHLMTGGFNQSGSFEKPVTIFNDGIRLSGVTLAEGAQIVMIDAESGDE